MSAGKNSFLFTEEQLAARPALLRANPGLFAQQPTQNTPRTLPYVAASTTPKTVRSDKGTKRPRHFNTCKQCGKEFHAPHAFKRKFCSPECASAGKTRAPQCLPKERGSAICGRCGKSFKITTVSPRGLFCSQSCACALNSKGHHGWTEIGDQRIYTRSRWEANYARYLEWLRTQGLIAKWEYEPETFWFEKIKRGARSYLPDFRVTLPGGLVEFHEVKGYMDRRSKTKLKRMGIYHPSVTIILIDQHRYRALNRTVSAIVPGWTKAR